MSNLAPHKPGPCPEERELERFFLNELPPAELESFLDHVSSCPKCRKRFQVMNAVKQELEARTSEVPESLRPDEAEAWRAMAKDEVGKAAADSKAKPLSPFLRPLWALRLVAPAALLLVVMIGGFLFLIKPALRHDHLRVGVAGDLRLIAPSGEVSAVPTRFEWTPVKGVKVYWVTLIDDKLQRLFADRSPHIDASLQLPEEVRSRIVPGVPYVWTVIATDEKHFQLGTASASFVVKPPRR